MVNQKECDCKAFHIKLWLVFTYDLTTRLTTLRVVCRSKETADRYEKSYKTGFGITGRAWVEEIISDHSFAATMYQN